MTETDLQKRMQDLKRIRTELYSNFEEKDIAQYQINAFPVNTNNHVLTRKSIFDTREHREKAISNLSAEACSPDLKQR